MSLDRPDDWDSSARQYDSFEKRWSFYGTVAEALLGQIAIAPGSRVLELACGTGACTLRLARASAPGGTVVALDFSEEMLAVAGENVAAASAGAGGCVSFVKGDAGEVAGLLAGRTFDYAVCNSAFWHFPDPGRVLAGLRSLLTKEGELALSVPVWVGGSGGRRAAYSAEMRELLLRHGAAAEAADAALLRLAPGPELPDVLSASGFEVLRAVPFEFEVSPESRDAWGRISAFSGGARATRQRDRESRALRLAGVDPLVADAVVEELDARRAQGAGGLRPRSTRPSRWLIYVARASAEVIA
ncbi:MAG: methyltransferase domain-containing protein [Nitrososphaerales archaeon]